MNWKDGYLIFKGFADPQRMKIIELLRDKEECNCNLSEALGMPLSTLAHHMKVLTASGVVDARKCGKWTYYSLNKDQIILATKLINEFIDGDAKIPD